MSVAFIKPIRCACPRHFSPVFFIMTQRISPAAVIVNVPQVGTEGRMKTTQYTEDSHAPNIPSAQAAEDVIDSESERRTDAR
jgi:hypothetical protein